MDVAGVRGWLRERHGVDDVLHVSIPDLLQGATIAKDGSRDL